jgi:hypothetical protein
MSAPVSPLPPTASTIHNRLLHGPRRCLPAADAVTPISLPYWTDRAHVTIIECASSGGALVVKGGRCQGSEPPLKSPGVDERTPGEQM